MGQVVLAPDKFKGSRTAAHVAQALATAIHAARPEADALLTEIGTKIAEDWL